MCSKIMLLLVLAFFSAHAQATKGLRTLANNPLLQGVALPRYAEIKPQHVEEAMQHLVRLTEEKIAFIEKDEATDFDSLFEALGDISIYYSRIWLPIDHLHSVRNEEELRPLHEEAEQQITALELKLAQNPVIYRKLLALEKNKNLDAVQQRLVKIWLHDAQQQGIGLEGKTRERFNAISEELAALGSDFTNNTLDATKAFKLLLHDKSEIAGLPDSFLVRAAQNYEEVMEKTASATAGPWLITLDVPIYKPFMEYSERRDLREQLYRAYTSIAAHEPYDNTPLIKRILQLRKEKAQLLGFANHIELVLSDKMAGNADTVKKLLDELHVVGYPNMLKEREQLKAYAAANGGPADFAVWDIPYWARKIKEAQLDIDPEALRQYFPLPRVLDGLFSLLGKMFGISIEENTTGVQVWHDDVKFYDVHDADGTHIASFYFDPYSRPQNKSGGAWVMPCNKRNLRDGVLEIPVCNIVASFTPPTPTMPALLDMWEVETLFHEFGHAMHELLTTITYSDMAGMYGVELDAVEMPSSLLESFVYVDRIVPTISAHVETGQPLPPEMLARLQQLKNFRIASQLQFELFYSYLDLQLHSDFDPYIEDILKLLWQVYQLTLSEPPLDTYRFLHSLLHIFAGSYDGLLYSYAWGEVLAADIFAMFVENGFDDEGLQRSGRMLRDIVLAVGGSKPSQEIFLELRGRMPSAQALLRKYGLVEE